MDKCIENILLGFDIPAFNSISEIKNAVWDIDSAYVLKQTDSLDCVKKNIELTRQLLEKGILVIEFIAAKTGEFYVKAGTSYYLLMHKMQGGHMDIHNGDYLLKAKQIGENAALLCRALESCVYNGGYRFEYDMVKYLNGEYVERVKEVNISSEVIKYINDFHPLYKKLPRQIIHSDLNPANIVFDDAEFKGFIDFDMAQRNVRIYDICYLLQDVFQNEPEKMTTSFEIVNCIFESYCKMNPLTEEEKQAIPYMLVLIGALESVWTFIHDGDKNLSDFHIKRTNWMFSNKKALNFT